MGSKGVVIPQSGMRRATRREALNDEFPLKIDSFFSPSVKSIK